MRSPSTTTSCAAKIASAVDAAILGREDDLLRVFRRELTPMAALVRGKVRVKGSRAALLRLAGILPEG